MTYILLFHGSKYPKGKVVASNLKKKLINDFAVTNFEICYLQYVEPTLLSTLNRLVARGITNIHIIPLFLLPGTHLDEGIPCLLEQFKQNNKQVTVTLDKCLTEAEDFVLMLAKRIS